MEARRSGAPGPSEQRGATLERISNAVVGLYRECFGKGPSGAKTYVLDDLVICVLRDGFTRVERTLFERGRAEVVRGMREAFQEAVADRFTGAVEELTGRRVVAFLSQAHVDPDLTIEVFFMDGPVAARPGHETNGDFPPLPPGTLGR